MAAKYFCDSCGDELTPETRTSRDQQGRLFGRAHIPGGHTMFVQVVTGMDSTWNQGDYCNACIAACLNAALESTSKEPREAPDHLVGAPQEA